MDCHLHTHEIVGCKHEELKYCPICGEVYCARCGFVWHKLQYIYQTYPYTYIPATTSPYPITYPYTVTCNSGYINICSNS